MNHPDRLRTLLVILFAPCILLVVISVHVQAQILPTHGIPTSRFTDDNVETRIQGGVVGSLGRNYWSPGMPMVFQPLCNRLQYGNGVGFTIGGTLEYLLTRELRISAHVRHISHTARFDRHTVIGSTRLREGEPIQLIVANIKSDVRYEAIESDVLVKYRLGTVRNGNDAIGIAAGPEVGFPTKGLMSQAHQLGVYDSAGTKVGERQFYGEEKERIGERTLADYEEMTEMRPVQISFRTGLFYTFRISGSLFFEPGIYADLPLHPFTTSDWGTLTVLEAQAELLFSI